MESASAARDQVCTQLAADAWRAIGLPWQLTIEQASDLFIGVGDDRVIMLSSEARLDLTFGAIPSFIPPEERALSFLPPRITSEGRGIAPKYWRM